MNEEELIEDGELIATAEPITTDDIDNAILNPEPNKVTPTNTTGGKFPSAFGKKYGHSSVDLSIQKNEDRMLDEYNTWWNHGLNMGLVAEDKKDERGKLRDNWYQKYHGMSFEDYTAAEDQQPKKSIYGYEANLKGFGEQFDNVFQGLSNNKSFLKIFLVKNCVS